MKQQPLQEDVERKADHKRIKRKNPATGKVEWIQAPKDKVDIGISKNEEVEHTIEGFDVEPVEEPTPEVPLVEMGHEEDEEEEPKEKKAKGKKSKKVDDTDDVDAGEGGVAEETYPKKIVNPPSWKKTYAPGKLTDKEVKDGDIMARRKRSEDTTAQEEIEWSESDLPNQFESWNSLTNNDKDKLIKMHRMMNKEKKARDLQTIKKNMGAAVKDANARLNKEGTSAEVLKKRYSSDHPDDNPHNTKRIKDHSGMKTYKMHPGAKVTDGGEWSKKGKMAALKKQIKRRPKQYGVTEDTLKDNLLNILKSNAFDLVNDKKLDLASFGDFEEAYSRKSVINSKDRHTGADDHIVMQLRNAQDLGGKKKVKFHKADSKGNKHHELHPDHIKKVLDWHDHPQRTPREKRMLRVGIKSHDHFKRVAKAIK